MHRREISNNTSFREGKSKAEMKKRDPSLSFVLLSVLVFHVQDSQQMLGRLIPEKQLLNDQLKQVQQNSLHRE